MESSLDRQLEGHPTSFTLMAALDKELSTEQASAVERHVINCPRCVAQWERLQQVSGRLAEFHLSTSQVSPPPEFELHLPSDKSPVSLLDAIVSTLRRPQFLMPAVALTTLGIGLMLWISSRSPVAHVPGPSLPVVTGQAETTTLAAIKPTAPATSPRQTEAIRSQRHSHTAGRSTHVALPPRMPVPEAHPALSETAEVFWSLPYSDPALTAEGAEMVRADLPREAFLMAGVPLANIPAAGPKDRIPADIVIGADGLPRAIRPARRQASETVIPTQL